ncbi:MAG: hypothetical protein M3N68_13120 [Actinomycetota bacterium]|nr:hypothetical protein [Actinomycetota bacterium]
MWEKRNPLLRFGDRGEAYCFSFEFLSALLRQFRDEWELVVPYESHLATALAWAERNAISGHGPPLWRSGLAIEESKAESWATAAWSPSCAASPTARTSRWPREAR